MAHSNSTKEILTLRVPRAFVDEVRAIAQREAESQSTILRRLVRVGLDLERRTASLQASR